MDRRETSSTFTSYLPENATIDEIRKTKFLDGEATVCEAQHVLMYNPLNEGHKVRGVLTVTTFKLSFATNDDCGPANCHQQNFLLGVNDVCLSSIDCIYQLGERTRKKLVPGQSISGKVKELLVICKNMRYFEFSFIISDKDSGKLIANALVHHAFPQRHQLLFAYDYKEPYTNNTILKEVALFYNKHDWDKELQRTCCPGWRLSHVNQNYETCSLLVETLIVPQSVTDVIINGAVEKFRNRLCPVWVWGNKEGAALVRMADLLPTITTRTEENKLLEHIRKSHPQRKAPRIMDLSYPTAKEIQASYLKFRELCTPESPKVFKSQDIKFYGLLDSTKWLHYVSQCLTKARETAELISKENSTVVLQEGNGQDLNCLVGSLAQIILDPHFRTKYGFQSLIQKDWIAMGHPFAARLGHTLSKETDTLSRSPIFLLFLDCVWQLMQQYPAAFSINDIYLTTLWDSAHINVFDTFLFNCHHQRHLAHLGNFNMHPPLTLRSVWDWREQFGDRDLALLCNPLYDDSFNQILEPLTTLRSLDIWSQCYFRWLSDLEIVKGGQPQIDFFARLLVQEIVQLRFEMQNSNGKMVSKVNKTKEEYLDLIEKVNGFFPFSQNSASVSNPTNNVLLTGDTLDSQSILNFNNE